MTVNMLDEFGFGGGTEIETGTYPTILKLPYGLLQIFQN